MLGEQGGHTEAVRHHEQVPAVEQFASEVEGRGGGVDGDHVPVVDYGGRGTGDRLLGRARVT
jgi:hypothetical protein